MRKGADAIRDEVDRCKPTWTAWRETDWDKQEREYDSFRQERLSMFNEPRPTVRTMQVCACGAACWGTRDANTGVLIELESHADYRMGSDVECGY